MLRLLWEFREGYFTPTDDEWVSKRLDDDGDFFEFLIHEMSTLKQRSQLSFELAFENPSEHGTNVTVWEACYCWDTRLC